MHRLFFRHRAEYHSRHVQVRIRFRLARGGVDPVHPKHRLSQGTRYAAALAMVRMIFAVYGCAKRGLFQLGGAFRPAVGVTWRNMHSANACTLLIDYSLVNRRSVHVRGLWETD